VDAIYEPIRSYTWADAAEPIVTLSGDTITPGGKTIENRFAFSNALLRIGFGRDLDLQGLEKAVGLQLGLVVRSITYHLQQNDHVELTQRSLETGWLEWSPTWGLSLRFPELEIRYQGRVTKGAGRPGSDFVVLGLVTWRSAGRSRGGTGRCLVGANTSTHQISFLYRSAERGRYTTRLSVRPLCLAVCVMGPPPVTNSPRAAFRNRSTRNCGAASTSTVAPCRLPRCRPRPRPSSPSAGR
jgi:hypothetical protein